MTKLLVASLIVATGAYWTGIAAENYRGICRQTKTLLSEADLLVAGFNRAYNSALASTSALDRDGVEAKRVVYRSFEDFNQRNPNCCSLSQSGPLEEIQLGFWDKITGTGRTFVTLRYLSSDSTGPIMREDYYIVSNCGKLFDIFD